MTFPKSTLRGLVQGLAGTLLFAFAAQAGAASAQSSSAKGGSVWMLRGKHNTVYLAGSVHALPKDDAAFSPQLEQAYLASDAIVMEVDLDDMNPLEAVQFVASNGTLPANQTLEDVVGKDHYVDITHLATSVDVPEVAITRLEPWAAAMVLTQFALMKSGFDPQLGIDLQITERARVDNKPIDGLETVVEQLSLFDSRSLEEQTRFLIDAANDVPKMHEDLALLIAAWRRGDLRALDREFRKERAQDPALYDALLGARNRKWLPKIEALLDGDRNYLVLVGALHYVGRDGLLALLKRDGHKAITVTAPPATTH